MQFFIGRPMNSELLRALEAEPDWDSMTAYQRTVVYCREATRQGKKIPAWTAIREQVGKGSPADIRRAVADFRREQADTFKNSEQGLAEFPPPVAKLFQKAWLMAIDEARDGFAADRGRWELQLVEMQGNITQARGELRAAADKTIDLERQLAESKKLISDLMSQQAELVEQLKTAHKKNQALMDERGELEKSVTELTAAAGEARRENQSLQRELKKANDRIDALVKLKR